MKHNKSFILHYSLFAGLICAFAMPRADAVVRVGNKSRSYAEAYNQINNQRAQVEYQNQQSQNIQNDQADLPVRVADADLAKQIARGDNTARAGIGDLESCARIYPNGEFAWDVPTAGMGTGGAQTCVAVVEMRGLQMGPGGTDVVLARANVAAGDAVKCNISEFPESGYTPDAMNITFPADAAPTVDDVVRVLNSEQKKGAGFKIAASAIVGGLGGNMLGKNEIGEESLMGTGKKKMKNSAVGALVGAAVGAGNAYGGKVGGDVILSTSVNAAAGGIMGNIVATGNSVMRIEECKLPNGVTTSCLWGVIVTSNPIKLTAGQINPATGQEIPGDVKTAFFNVSDGSTVMICDQDAKNCREDNLVSIKLIAYPDKDIEVIKDQDFEKITIGDSEFAYHLTKENGNLVMAKGPGSEAIYTPILSAGRPEKTTPAMVANVHDKTFGMKRSDWRDEKKRHTNNDIYGRTGRGEAFDLSEGNNYDLNDFSPMTINAEDGGIIDLDNKARLKATVIGAGAGGAIGALSGYQGAQKDIDDRWVTAVREYNDSLQKVYCQTGKRFLSFYNDMVIIPHATDE